MDPVRLVTFTTVYVPEEDRIAIDGRTGDSETLRIWLTRRLLKRLLPKIHEKVLLDPPNESPTETPAEAGKKTRKKEAKNPPKTDPVRIEDDNPVLLATKASYRSSKKFVLVQFGNQDAMYEIVFTLENLKSWFQIIQRHCLVAEWPVEEFISTQDISTQKLSEMNTLSSTIH